MKKIINLNPTNDIDRKQLEKHKELTQHLFNVTDDEYVMHMQPFFQITTRRNHPESICNLKIDHNTIMVLLRADFYLISELPTTLKELTQIPGIGKIRAQEILKLINSMYGNTYDSMYV